MLIDSFRIYTCYSSQRCHRRSSARQILSGQACWGFRAYSRCYHLSPELLWLQSGLISCPLPPVGYFIIEAGRILMKHRQPCHLSTHNSLRFASSLRVRPSISTMLYTASHSLLSCRTVVLLLPLSLSLLPPRVWEEPWHSQHTAPLEIFTYFSLSRNYLFQRHLLNWLLISPSKIWWALLPSEASFGHSILISFSPFSLAMNQCMLITFLYLEWSLVFISRAH